MQVLLSDIQELELFLRLIREIMKIIRGVTRTDFFHIKGDCDSQMNGWALQGTVCKEEKRVNGWLLKNKFSLDQVLIILQQKYE